MISCHSFQNYVIVFSVMPFFSENNYSDDTCINQLANNV